MAAGIGQGPHDTKDLWTANSAGLGACVLHTTVESLEAGQPWLSDGGTIALVFDGYLTNWEDLRRDLNGRGARLRNRSDAELVLRAYEAWGEGCADRIEGEFAFVVIDLDGNKAYCARDHQGLRPLYYAMEKGVFIAASSIALVLEGLGHEPDFNLDFLAEVMIGEVVTVDQTGWAGIMRLKPAHTLAVAQGRAHTRRYYSPPDPVITNWKSDAAYIEEYRGVLEEAVRRTSRSHRPLALEVSGGLDSSALFCIADRLEGERRLLAPSMQGYSLRGEQGADSDEIEFARAAAFHVGRELHEERLFRPDLDWFNAEVGRHRDMPGYTNTAHSILLERRMVQDGARVSINGAGGDQWLDGSLAYYDQFLAARQFGRLARSAWRDSQHYGIGTIGAMLMRKSILSLLPDRVRPRLRGLKRDNRQLYTHEVQYLLRERVRRVRQAHRDYLATLPVNEVARISRRRFDGVANQRANELMYRQRASLGLEGRSPMLTRQFIEFCALLPEDLKRRDGKTKWVHRQAMKGAMPTSIVERYSKAGFPERKHDAAIRDLLAGEFGEALAPLVDSDRFAAFVELHTERDIDDVWGWPYWASYIVAVFMASGRQV